MTSHAKKQYNEIDRALEGVPFRIDPRLQAISNYDFSRVNEILSRPLPTNGLSERCENLLANMGVVEAQVLKQLEDIENERNAKIAKEKRDREELEQRRAKAEAEENSEKEAIEDKVVESEDIENGNDTSPADTETEPSTASISDPPTILPMTLTSSVATASGGIQQVTKPTNINFSEFEAECDPFERAELQTINDLQELAAVLQTTAASTYPTSTPATFASSLSTSGPPPTYEMATAVGATPKYPYYPIQQNQFQYHQPPHPPSVFYQQPPPIQVGGATNGVSSDMKSSKSVGDIMVEIQKEAEAFEKLKLHGHQRKNSKTPPPRSSVQDEWIPWPDIDAPSQRQQQSEILKDLSPASQEICRQISEMGFSLERVVKGCKSFGDNNQKIINYCLMVEDLVNEVGKSSAEEVEYVIPIHNMDREVSMKHLKAFFKLEELGFNRLAIHNALVSAKLDHDKALEQLLK